MSGTPIVLVVSDKITHEGGFWFAAREQYLTPLIEISGGIPLLVPAFGNEVDIQSLLAVASGLYLTGAYSNVHPPEYGKEATEKAEPYDTSRDATSLPLIRAAIAADMPIFAICRGHQELNVALGGSILPEIHEAPNRMDHRPTPEAEAADDNDQRFAIRHNTQLMQGGKLAKILGADNILINSLHRQGIDDLASGLTVEALAEDGLIEAVSIDACSHFAFGVQWHPEYWAASDTASQELFIRFGQAIKAYQSARGAYE